MVVDQDQVSVTDLIKATGASRVTIRQDLNILGRLSCLRCAHGSAASLDGDDVEAHMMSNCTLKRKLAEFAASLVQLGETILIKNGSSNALLTRTLGKQKKNVTIITVSSYIAHLLEDAPYKVILLGDVCQKRSGSMVGPLARQCVQQVYLSKASTGIDGWQPEAGFTGRDMMRTDVVNAMPEREYEVIVLIDSSKFGVVHSYSISPVERPNYMVTDSRIRASDLMHLRRSKLTVHVADI